MGRMDFTLEHHSSIPNVCYSMINFSLHTLHIIMAHEQRFNTVALTNQRQDHDVTFHIRYKLRFIVFF